MARRVFPFTLFQPRRDGSQQRGIRVGVTGSSSLAPVSAFGQSVNNDRAMKITAFYAGIRLISENVASLPKIVTRNTEKGPVAVPDHPVSRLLANPNEYTNGNAFHGLITTWVKGWGNACAIIQRNSAGIPIQLHQVHPSEVLQIAVIEGHKWYKIQKADPDFAYLNGVYKDDDILHFMDVTLDGIRGVNPVFYNAAALGKSLATENFASEYYEKGGNIRAVMETDGNLGEGKYKVFMDHFAEASKNFGTPLLEYGVKYKQLNIDPLAAQLIQSETMSLQDICRILGVPPHMLCELSHATFSNIEHQTIQFVQYTLRPTVKKQEVEYERKLFFGRESGNYNVKFVLDGLLRGDTAARSAYYHNAILDGYMSRNEVRELEGLEHADGLDDFLVPLNEGVAGQDNTKTENNA